MFNVLFLCTGNSCRSILAEAYLNHIGQGRFQAYSAGSKPTGEVNPGSLATLHRHGIATDGLHSKSWNDLQDTTFDLVVTVCDNAAGEVCPFFPGKSLKVHWGVPDPAHLEGTVQEVQHEFERVFSMLKAPLDQLSALPTHDKGQRLAQQIKSIEAKNDPSITTRRL